MRNFTLKISNELKRKSPKFKQKIKNKQNKKRKEILLNKLEKLTLTSLNLFSIPHILYSSYN